MLKSGLIVWILVGILNHPPSSRSRFAAPPQPAVPFRVLTDSEPQARIAGVVLPAGKNAKGTLILCHGYGLRKEFLYGWDWIRKQQGWNIVLFDFREHGQSTHSPLLCTLGYHEIWDVKAVIDYAEQQGLAEPYAICGYSLGASIGLRWGAMDSRVKGVLAVSPYRNGLAGAQQFLRASFGVRRIPLSANKGLGKMLATVDLPRDVAGRTDLRIWIMVGEHDIFPPADAKAILDASPAPDTRKRLLVVPNAGHNHLWRWKGDAAVPSHDQIMLEFLHTCRSD